MVLVVVVALIGLVLSAAAHAATFFAPAAPWLSSAWLLNLGLCAVWLPLLVIGTYRIFDIVHVGHKWTLIPRHAPEWSKRVAAGLLLYAVFNFLFTMIVLNQGAYPAVVEGRYVLHTYNFGVVLRELTPAEFQLHQAYTLRASSGHWVFMFYMAALGAHSHVVARRLERTARRSTAAGAVAPALTLEQAE